MKPLEDLFSLTHAQHTKFYLCSAEHNRIVLLWVRFDINVTHYQAQYKEHFVCLFVGFYT